MTAFLTIVVHIAFSLDASIHSSIVRTTPRTEAAAIWRAYGVELTFGDDPHADVCIAAFVDRMAGRRDATAPTVLGSTFVPHDPGAAPEPVRIRFDDIDELAAPAASANPILHEYSVGAAIGRVLAHEIGHILLGPPGYHDREGLMRSNFMTDDFRSWDRSRYRLAPKSIERLHERLPSLSASAATGCIGS